MAKLAISRPSAEAVWQETAQTGSRQKEHSGYTFSDKISRDDLPSFLLPVIDAHADTVSRDKMLLGVLNVVSGLMGGANGNADAPGGVYGIYDGRTVYAPLFNIVYGSAGSAKGDITFCSLLAQPVKQEMRRAYEAARAQYDSDMADYEAQSRGKKRAERGPAPQEPVYRTPFVPGNSSSSAVYRALEANGGWGMMFETEADTVSAMLDSDYGNYSDLLRRVFHHETVSMNRTTDRLHIDIDRPRLSVLLTCTPGQLTRLFPSFEDGFGSRFVFYGLPDEGVEFHDVFASNDNPTEGVYRRMGDSLLPLYHSLQERAGRPVQFVLSNSQQRQFLETYREVLQEQFGMLGAQFKAFVFRLALSCFRYAMVLSTLRRLSEWLDGTDIFAPDAKPMFRPDESALVCDDRDFATAMTIIGCLINHTSRIYALMAKESENPFAAQQGMRLSGNERRLLDAMPEGEISSASLAEIGTTLGMQPRTSRRVLSNLCNKFGLVEPIRFGIYRKVPCGGKQQP